MATILVAWELGGGLGHVLPLRPLVRGLVERGHRVFAAMKDLGRAGSVFDGLEIEYLAAPFHMGSGRSAPGPARTFAHVLLGVGYGRTVELRAIACAWRNLYDFARPDLVLCDHSPTALLAARGLPMKRAVFGIPFACPPDVCPLPDLRPWMGDPGESLRRDEDRVLQCVNEVLGSWGEPGLDRLAGLYHPADETFLTTFAELDHCTTRNGTTHWGPWPSQGGEPPDWPDGRGKRVFAYLKSFPALPGLLGVLRELRCPTLVYLDKNDARLRKRFASPSIRFVERRLDLAAVGRECDLAILNAGHATAATMLLAGRPVLQLPIYLEQTLNAAATVRLGAALAARIARPEEIAVKLMAMLSSGKYAEAAARFAQRHADFDPKVGVEKALDRIDELVGPRG